jgi:hypothetical protein
MSSRARLLVSRSRRHSSGGGQREDAADEGQTRNLDADDDARRETQPHEDERQHRISAP